MNLKTVEYTCGCCGKVHMGLPDAYVYQKPDNWCAIGSVRKAVSHISSDFCRIYDYPASEYYLRCVLRFPIKDSDDSFEFGVWMSVSKRSYKIYRKAFQSEDYEEDGCFGYLLHNLPEFPSTWALHCNVDFQKGGKRPIVTLQESDHPLFDAQENGLTLDYVIRLTGSNSHL